MIDDKQQIEISQSWEFLCRRHARVHNAQLMIHSQSRQLHLKTAYGPPDQPPTHPDQPFHTASVGKMFTGILIAQLVEQGRLGYEDEIARYLEADLMKGLHVFKGHDYSGTLRIQDLLNHTSGLADYYEDKPRKRPPFVDQLLQTLRSV